jgi:hypothetical protein
VREPGFPGKPSRLEVLLVAAVRRIPAVRHTAEADPGAGRVAGAEEGAHRTAEEERRMAAAEEVRHSRSEAAHHTPAAGEVDLPIHPAEVEALPTVVAAEAEARRTGRAGRRIAKEGVRPTAAAAAAEVVLPTRVVAAGRTLR